LPIVDSLKGGTRKWLVAVQWSVCRAATFTTCITGPGYND